MSLRYAKIAGGSVVDTQMWGHDPGVPWVRTDTAIPGDLWDGSSFTPRPLTPEEQAAKDANDAEIARRASYKSDITRQQFIQRVKTSTPQQLRDYVNANVTDLASAKAMLGHLLVLIALDGRNGG